MARTPVSFSPQFYILNAVAIHIDEEEIFRQLVIVCIGDKVFDLFFIVGFLKNCHYTSVVVKWFKRYVFYSGLVVFPKPPFVEFDKTTSYQN